MSWRGPGVSYPGMKADTPPITFSRRYLLLEKLMAERKSLVMILYPISNDSMAIYKTVWVYLGISIPDN
jgi:hypothetical protein